ncbi:MAG: hypothetical protein HY537_01240 [Deltaproteobacteria bacterium]|nr:hypothetical protein [Deltaproteobacteria bacterium]
MILFAIILFILPQSALASKVIKISRDGSSIAVSQNDQTPWGLGDHLCVLQAGAEIACGQVIKRTNKGAMIRLKSKDAPIQVGDYVQPAARTPKEQPFFADPEHASEEPVKRSDFTHSARTLTSRKPDTFESNYGARGKLPYSYNFTIGLNYIFPTLILQIALSRHYALGIQPIYHKYSVLGVNASGFGGLASLNYYGASPFSGFWMQGAVGLLYNAQINYRGASGNSNSETVLLTAGYRWLGDNVNLGIGLGAQYFHLPKNTDYLPFDFGLVLPTLLVDIGIAF